MKEVDIWRWRRPRGELQRFRALVPEKADNLFWRGEKKKSKVWVSQFSALSRWKLKVFTLGLLSQTGAPEDGGGGGGGVDGHSLKLLLLHPAPASSFGLV